MLYIVSHCCKFSYYILHKQAFSYFFSSFDSKQRYFFPLAEIELTYYLRLLIFTKNTYFFSLCFKKYYEQSLWLSLYLFNNQSIACNIFIRFPSISTTLVLVNAISVRFSQRNDVEALTSELVSRLYVFSFSIS